MNEYHLPIRGELCASVYAIQISIHTTLDVGKRLEQMYANIIAVVPTNGCVIGIDSVC